MIEYSEYILPMVAVATYIICAVLKLSVLKCKTTYLPLIAAVVGVFLAFWMQGNLDFSTFVSGLVSGFGAVGIDQAISIPIKSAGKDNTEE